MLSSSATPIQFAVLKKEAPTPRMGWELLRYAMWHSF